MSTANLNLPTLAGSGQLGDLPAAFNDAMGKIDGALPSGYLSVSDWLASAESGSGAACFIMRFGKIVCLDLRTISRLHAENDVIATIPSGYRPKATIDVPAWVNAEGRGVVRIQTDGTVKVWVTPGNAAAGRVYLYCSYVID